jgi:hypothetical protein
MKPEKRERVFGTGHLIFCSAAVASHSCTFYLTAPAIVPIQPADFLKINPLSFCSFILVFTGQQDSEMIE